MKYDTIKRIGKIALIGSILYFLHTRESIAPGGEKLTKDPRKVIVLDIGHGRSNKKLGKMDFGAMYKDYIEADIVQEQAIKVKNMLNPSYYKVILTRKNPGQDAPLESRSELANKLNADLFISFHINDNPKVKNLRGFEIYYRDEKSGEFAESTAKNLEAMTSIPKKWIRKEDYVVLKDLNCPGILVESGYVRSKKDIESITDTIPDVEKAIVKSIEEYPI